MGTVERGEYKPFYGRVWELADRQGLSKSSLARLAEISPSYLTDLINGRSRGREDIRRRLAAAVGADYDALISDLFFTGSSSSLASRLPLTVRAQLGGILMSLDSASSPESLKVVQDGSELNIINVDRRQPKPQQKFAVAREERVLIGTVLESEQGLMLHSEGKVVGFKEDDVIGRVEAIVQTFDWSMEGGDS